MPRWRMERIEVRCYSGYRLNESPRAFLFLGKWHTVVEVLDQWYEGGVIAEDPIVHYFKVLTDEGETNLLRYDSFHDEWTLVIRSSEKA